MDTGHKINPSGLTPEVIIPLHSYQIVSNKVRSESNSPMVMVIEGKISIRFFKKVVDQIISRHDALRSSFRQVGGQYLQTIHKKVYFSIDYRKTVNENVDDIVCSLALDFDVAKPPLFRIYLIKITDEKHLFVFDMHYLITDEMSHKIILKEIVGLYNGKVLPRQEINYSDYTRWQQKKDFKTELAAQKRYWLKKLNGKLPAVNLPTDFPRPIEQKFIAKTISINLNIVQSAKLKIVAELHQSTLEQLFFALYNILLMKSSGQQDLIVGMPVNIREINPMNAMVGFFTNPLPIRTNPAPDKTFSEYFDQVINAVNETEDNKYYLFDELLDDLKTPRDKARHPVYDTFFTYHDMSKSDIRTKGLRVTQELFIHKTTRCDLTFYIKKFPNGIEVIIAYHTSLFCRERMERLGQNFVFLIEQILHDPLQKIGRLQLLG